MPTKSLDPWKLLMLAGLGLGFALILLAQAQQITPPYLVYGWVKYPNATPVVNLTFNVTVNITNRTTGSVVCTLYNDTSPEGGYVVNLGNCPAGVTIWVGDFANATAKNESLGWWGINNSTLLDTDIGGIENNVSVCYYPLLASFAVASWVLWPNGTGIAGALVQLVDLNVTCYWSTTTAANGSWSMYIESCPCATGERKHITVKDGYALRNPSYGGDKLYYNASWDRKCFNETGATRGDTSPQYLPNLTLGVLGISIDPIDYYFGIVPYGKSAATSGGRFNATNIGNCISNFTANATNTTNWTIVTTSPGNDEFRLNLSYYSCPAGATCLNLSLTTAAQDVFMLVDPGKSVLFDLKFEAPSNSNATLDQKFNLTLGVYLA